MDDKTFDKHIKSRMEDYQETGYDPVALTDLHRRIDASAYLPWYTQYRNELLITSGIVILILLNTELYPRLFDADNQALHREISDLKFQQHLLEEESQQLVTKENTIVDTVYIQSRKDLELEREMVYLKSTIRQLYIENNQVSAEPKLSGEESYYLGSRNEVSKELISQLNREGNIVTRGHQVFLVMATEERGPNIYPMQPDWSYTYMQNHPYNEMAYVEVESKKEGEKASISTRQLRDLKKHYMKGIGVRLAPNVGLLTMKNDVGDGPVTPEIGIMTELLFSPSLSLDLGLNYHKWIYEAEENFEQLFLPNAPANGELITAEVDASVLEFPINLRYRYPVSDKTQLITSVGLSPVYYMEQGFEYDYLLDVQVNGTTVTVNVNENAPTQNTNEFYFSMLNLGIGANKRFKNNKHLEFMLNYQRALTEMGIEGVKPNIIGLRARYWFTIR